MCTTCLLHVYYSLDVYHSCTTYVLHVQYMCTTYRRVLHVHWMYTTYMHMYELYTYYMSAAHVYVGLLHNMCTSVLHAYCTCCWIYMYILPTVRIVCSVSSGEKLFYSFLCKLGTKNEHTHRFLTMQPLLIKLKYTSLIITWLAYWLSSTEILSPRHDTHGYQSQ